MKEETTQRIVAWFHEYRSCGMFVAFSVFADGVYTRVTYLQAAKLAGKFDAAAAETDVTP